MFTTICSGEISLLGPSMKRQFLSNIFLGGLLGLCLSCSRYQVENASEAMRKSAPLQDVSAVTLNTDEGWLSLKDATVKRLSKKADTSSMTFGPCRVSTQDYQNFLSDMPKEEEGLRKFLETEAIFFEVYGRDDWSQILLTSYFSPLYEARKRPEGEFTQAVYKVPKDLIEVSLASFSHEDLAELETDRSVVSARVADGPGVLKRVLPYFNRWEIDGEKVLKGRGLELAYLRPIDAFFLQIQGSGQVEFKDGSRMTLGYGAQNGYRYKSIGKLLYHIIPKEKMSMGAIEGHLKTLNDKELTEFLAKNPSYVFFKVLEGKKGITTFGTEVHARRTIAVDTRFFPLGAMALLKYPHPVFSSSEEIEPTSFEDKYQWVFAHDTGGAIKGPDRADLYWGAGKIAQQAAGVMKHPANLWFVAPKSSCSM